MKKTLAILLTLAMVFALAACGSTATTATTTATPAETTTTVAPAETTAATSNAAPVILSKGPNGEDAVSATTLGLSAEDLAKVKAGNFTAAIVFHYGGNDWSTSQLKGLTDTFTKMGIKVIATTDANFSAEKQVSDIETVTALKPNLIISIPTDPVATADAYQRAADAGIKLVFMDNVPKGFTAGKNYVSCVSADNYGNGVVAADLIGVALGGKGKIGIVHFDVDFFVTNQRLEAFEKTMKDKYPDIQVVSKLGFKDPNKTSEVADAMLTQNPDIQAIFAHWDVPAEGVLSSLRAAGRTDIKLSTIDLGNNVAKEIAAGNILGLGAQLPYDQGVAEATLGAMALLGQQTPAYVAVPALRVDKSNILDAYKQVYHVDAPDWLVAATK
jgi:ribose transport system substrate-binding protein